MLLFKHFAILYYRLARELFTHARINLIYILICSKKARTEASDFIESKHKNNAKSINLKKLDETGLKTNNSSNSRKTSPTSKRGLPKLVHSSSDDSSSSDDEDSHISQGPRSKPNAKKTTPQPQNIPPTPSNKAKVHENPRKQSLPTQETSQPKQDVVPKEEKKPEVFETFTLTAKEGSQCFKNNILQQSKEKYGECLHLIQTKYEMLKFSKKMKDCEDVVVIKFLFARACTGLDTYQDIIAGHDKLDEIINKHKSVRFPAVYLGYALMFKKLNRYDKALLYAEKGVEWFENNLPCVTYSYPGTTSDPIEETKKDHLTTMFAKLRIEFKCPPKPDAICKFANCLKVNEVNHKYPSEKIWKSDPDFKSFYKVFCRLNCVLEYHETCWAQLKVEYTNNIKGAQILSRANKVPTEKDFFALPCLTPDCEGVIVRIEIVNSMDSKIIEDKKMIEKLEKEEMEKKEAEKIEKEKKAREFKQKQIEGKSKKQKKRERNRSKSSSEKDSRCDSVPKVIEEKENIENYNDLPDLSAVNSVPVAILKKNKEDNEEENVENKKKIKKQKEKNILSLEEFNGEPTQFDNRIERLAQMKKTVEAGSFSSIVGNHNGKLEDKMDNFLNSKSLNANAKAFIPPVKDPSLPPHVIEESIRTLVYQILKNNGPMKEADTKLTKDLSPDALKVVHAHKGLLNFLKSDERIGSYGNYLCLKGDAEKAKRLKDEEERRLQSFTSKPDLGNVARNIREKHFDKSNESFGLNEVTKEPSLLEKIKKQTQDATNELLPSLRSAVPSYRTEGVQTDVSSVDLDEEDDVFILKQTNTAMMEELQENKDKLFKIQNERKLENREFQDKYATMTENNARLVAEVEDLKETIQRRDGVFKDATKTVKDLKATRDNYENEHKKNVRLEKELRAVKQQLENEQKVTYQQNIKLQQQADKERAIKTLQLKCLKVDYEAKKAILSRKRSDNEQLIDHLTKIMGPGNSAENASLRSNIDKLNNWSANLFAALDNLHQRYEETKRSIDTSASNFQTNLEVSFDMSIVESPNLASIELDTLRLLTTASYNSGSSRPPLTMSPPFSQPPPSLAATSRPPPGLGAAQPPVRTSPVPKRNAAPASINPTPFTSASSNAPFPSFGPAPRVQTSSHSSSAPPPLAQPQAGKKPKANDKLIAKILAKHPQLSYEQADRHIQILRIKNNGKLSGLSVTDILTGVETLMREEMSSSLRSPPSSSGASASVLSRDNSDDTDPENNCSICLESMGDDGYGDSKRLNPCRHKFHVHCIDVRIKINFCTYETN